MALPSAKKTAAQSKSDVLRQLAPLLNIGMELAATVALFGAIGWFIDKYAGTSPLWFVILLVFGAVGGMVKFIRTALKATPQKPKRAKIPPPAFSDTHNIFTENPHE